MKYLIFSALILSTLLIPQLHTVLAKLSSKAQNKCESIFVRDDRFKSESAALICGKNFSDKEKQQMLIKLSLIHIFVVSGAHLLLLETLLTWLGFTQMWIYPLLLLYGFCCGLNPPIVRALIAYEMKQLSHRQNFNWSPLIIALISYLISIIWLQRPGDYLSLLLSTAAAFALCVGKGAFQQQLLIYFFSSLILTGFGLLHPLTIFYNLLLGPLIGFIFVPGAALAIIHQALADLFYLLLKVFYWVGEILIQPIDEIQSFPHYEKSIVVIILIALSLIHIVSHFIQVNQKRKTAN